MRLEPSPGSLHRSEADRSFRRAVHDRLPDEAKRELQETSIDDEDWARKWGVHAPVILSSIHAWRKGWDVDGYSPPDVPASWNEAFEDFTRRPPQIRAFKPFVAVLSEEEDLKIRADLQEQARLHPELAWSIQYQLQRRDEFILPLRRENEEARQWAALSPLSADPARESRSEFLDRAWLHWEARAEAAKMHKLTPASHDDKWREFDATWNGSCNSK